MRLLLDFSWFGIESQKVPFVGEKPTKHVDGGVVALPSVVKSLADPIIT